MNPPLLFAKLLLLLFNKKGHFPPRGRDSLFLEDYPAEVENGHFSLKKRWALKKGTQEVKSPDP